MYQIENIKDPEILHKVIDFQSCIIQGRSLKALFHQNINFYLSKSDADLITIYMHENEKVNVEYIFEEHRHFAHLFQKYILNKKSFKWEKFVNNCDDHFSSGLKYDRITNLYQMFKGFMSKKDAHTFTEALQMKNGIMMPIYAFDQKTKIGYVCFIFKSYIEVDMKKLEAVKASFQTILQPLYDKELNFMYTKCIRIDENMNLLTPKEKKITEKVLEGHTYAEIADILNISINTLKTHMKNIFNKYSIKSKTELFTKFRIHF